MKEENIFIKIPKREIRYKIVMKYHQRIMETGNSDLPKKISESEIYAIRQIMQSSKLSEVS